LEEGVNNQADLDYIGSNDKGEKQLTQKASTQPIKQRKTQPNNNCKSD
jgi:hypothetical protein